MGIYFFNMRKSLALFLLAIAMMCGSSEGDFRDFTGFTELFLGDFLESGYDSSSGGDSQELNFNTTDPSHGGKVVLHEEMVSFIIETPLAEDDVGSGVLDGLDHLGEVVGLHVL